MLLCLRRRRSLLLFRPQLLPVLALFRVHEVALEVSHWRLVASTHPPRSSLGFAMVFLTNSWRLPLLADVLFLAALVELCSNFWSNLTGVEVPASRLSPFCL